jgi:hypothetical protein
MQAAMIVRAGAWGVIFCVMAGGCAVSNPGGKVFKVRPDDMDVGG